MRNQYTSLMGKAWNLALKQKDEIVKKSTSREECLGHMGKLVDDIGRSWCRQQRFIFPGQELDELKSQLAPIYLEAFDKTRVVETQIMDQVKVHLDRRMKEVEEAFSERMDIARMEFEERARAQRDTMDRVRALVLKNKEILKSCKTETEAKARMQEAADKYAKDYVAKKGYAFPKEIIEELKDKLWPECREAWVKYMIDRKNAMMIQKKLDMKARRAIDSVRKTALIEMRDFAHEFETLAEFEEKMSVKIEETATQFSKEGNVDVSKEKVDTLKEELKPEMRKSFELAQKVKLQKKLERCEVTMQKQMKKIVSKCKTVPQCLKKMEIAVDTFMNGGKPLGVFDLLFKSADCQEVAALKRKLTHSFTDALLLQQYAGKKVKESAPKRNPAPKKKDPKKTTGAGSPKPEVSRKFLGLF